MAPEHDSRPRPADARKTLASYAARPDLPAEERAAVEHLLDTFPLAGRYVRSEIDRAALRRRSSDHHDDAHPGIAAYRSTWFDWHCLAHDARALLPHSHARAARIALALLTPSNTVHLYDLPRDPDALAVLLNRIPDLRPNA